MVKTAKRRPRGRAQPKKKMAPPRRRPTASARPGLDGHALSFAKMLADPCSAPLVHPVYPGGESGYLFRAESFATFGGAALETAGIVHWVPGYPNSSATELLAISGASPSTALTLATNTNSPGRTFLSNSAKGVRCIGACMKVTFPGAENARSGRVHYGITAAGVLDAGNTPTVDQVAQTLQHFTRTPADTFEVLWKPSIGDTEFNDPTEAAGALIRDRKSALTVCWAGLPAATGLTIHFTAIYEWTPNVGLGIGHNNLSKNLSRNTLDEVIDYLIRTGFTFVRGVGHSAGTGLVEGIARTFGIMPARGQTRRIAY